MLPAWRAKKGMEGGEWDSARGCSSIPRLSFLLPSSDSFSAHLSFRVGGDRGDDERERERHLPSLSVCLYSSVGPQTSNNPSLIERCACSLTFLETEYEHINQTPFTLTVRGGEEIVYLLQAGKRNFSTKYSHKSFLEVPCNPASEASYGIGSRESENSPVSDPTPSRGWQQGS